MYVSQPAERTENIRVFRSPRSTRICYVAIFVSCHISKCRALACLVLLCFWLFVVCMRCSLFTFVVGVRATSVETRRKKLRHAGITVFMVRFPGIEGHFIRRGGALEENLFFLRFRPSRTPAALIPSVTHPLFCWFSRTVCEVML